MQYFYKMISDQTVDAKLGRISPPRQATGSSRIGGTVRGHAARHRPIDN
jgi:hypothetical protein